MTEILYRCELHEIEQARQVLRERALPWIGEQVKAGRELVLEIKLLDDDITAKQRAYFHAVVLEEFSQFARPNGEKYPPAVWKAYLKDRFLPVKFVTYINPLTGKKSRRKVRPSTEELGIRGYAEFIDRCIAFAATDCGVEVSEPLPPELRPGRRKRAEVIDRETGEIMEVAA